MFHFCLILEKQENQENSTIDQPKSSNQVTIQTPSVTDEKAPSCAFKIGYDVWEPYQYLDIDNQVKGLDVELISPVIKKIGCKVEFIQGTWVNLLEQFQFIPWSWGIF